MQWKCCGIAIFYSLVSSYAFICAPMTSRSKFADIKAVTGESDELTPNYEMMCDYYIRDATKDDLSEVADLMMMCFTPEMNHQLRKMFEVCRLQTTFPHPDDQHFFLVACETTNDTDGNDEETIIGFCKVDGRMRTDMFATLCESFPQHIQTIPQTPYATDVAVHPNRRRRGVAKQIMREVEHRVRRWDFDSLHLGVETDNEHALNLYRGLGYEMLVERMVDEKNRCVHLLKRNILKRNGVD